MRKKRLLVLSMLLSLFLTACGGGGGGDDGNNNNNYTPDTTAPTVISTSPADSATDVLRNDVITATFSEAMDGSTITDTAFTVGGAGGAISYDGATKTATFTPAGTLSATTTYTATITTGVKDAAANPIDAEKVWSFTTGTGIREEEPNDDWSSAQSITLPVTIKGIASPPVEDDIYAFTVSSTRWVTITLTGGGSADLQLWSGSAEIPSGTPSNGTETITVSLSMDTYYIRVLSWNNYAVNYTITAD